MKPVVCICIDHNLVNHIMPVYNSIMEFTDEIDFYIICDKKIKNKHIKQYKDIATIITGIDIPEINTDKLKGINTIRSKAMYYRFLLPGLIKKDKIIYVEVDTIFQSDINELWNMDLNNNLLAAVLDSHKVDLDLMLLNQYGKNAKIDMKLGFDNILFASGLLVINAKKFREEKVYEEMIKFYKKYPMLDLLLMNIICNGRIKKINDEWCVPANYLKDSYCHITGIIYPRIKAYHWHGINKPWKDECNYQHIYNRYAFWFEKIYQILYNNKNSVYGKIKYNRCPGVRLFPYYGKWLNGNIIDLGCGTGDTVKLLRKKEYKAEGIDFINLKNNMIVGDITEKINLKKYDTSMCIDVFEHLSDKAIIKVLKNMQQTERQVITVHIGSDYMNNYITVSTIIDLHINIKTFDEWDKIISKYFIIIENIKIHDQQRLYLCKKKQ